MNYNKDDFSKPKIVYREISIEMEACIVPANWMLNNKLYMITSDSENLEYICAFLNSKLFSKIILSSVNFGGGKGEDFLGKVKLPLLTSNLTLLNKEPQEMDAIFYSQYRLSPNEIIYIETL